MGRLNHGSVAQNWATGPWFSRTKLGDWTMDQSPSFVRLNHGPIVQFCAIYFILFFNFQRFQSKTLRTASDSQSLSLAIFNQLRVTTSLTLFREIVPVFREIVPCLNSYFIRISEFDIYRQIFRIKFLIVLLSVIYIY